MSEEHFQFSDGSSNKFWKIRLDGTSFTVNFGRIGTAGQVQTKEFKSEAEAEKEYNKLVAEKLKKGYERVGEGGQSDAPVPAAVAPKAAPAIRPKPIEGPRAAQKPDADPHVRALYTEYVNQKRARNEATEHLSYDAVAKSLKESGDKLAQKHQGKRVDFEVALKDGVTVLRPVIK